MRVTEFKLGQWPPIFVEGDAMDWTRLVQDRVGDPGLLQETVSDKYCGRFRS
jgi:hypothetical protein